MVSEGIEVFAQQVPTDKAIDLKNLCNKKIRGNFMDSLLVQAILLGLLTAFIVIDWMTGTNNLSRPIVSSVFVGLIMGDLKMGIMMGQHWS